jgi:DNA-binding IclR family transcriptional regulator
MDAQLRDRDPDKEERERRLFLMLARVLTFSAGDVGAAVLCSRVADDLGLPRADAVSHFSELVDAGYLTDAGAGPSVSITPQGVLYVEHRAGRRHSVRVRVARRVVESGVVAALRRILRNEANDSAQCS